MDTNNQNDFFKLLDQNAEFAELFSRIELRAQSLFLTGRAGTGKSTFLQYFRHKTKKNVAVIAPTGVAALNVAGQTIHSFFNFKPDTTLDAVRQLRLSKNKLKLLKDLDTLVIDEISMVRADLLDCIDLVLRLHARLYDQPFGGVQMVFIGDMYQLPPVVRTQEKNIFTSVYKSPFFFDAKVFENFWVDFVELQTNYRQKDEEFVSILNAIRNNQISLEQLSKLNTRFQFNFKEPEGEFFIQLTTTNDLADRMNMEKLDAIKEELFSFEGDISGEFDERFLPTAKNLDIKVGAQVMLLNNDQEKRWINGSIGRVIGVDLEGSETTIRVELTDGARVDVSPFTWEIFNFFYDDEKKKLDSEAIGSFRQYPLRLAWAVTIHKAQGKTFDRVVIDFGSGTFSHGQSYVALSRCTTLEGIILKRPLQKRDILMDTRIPQFMRSYQYALAERYFPLIQRETLAKQAIENRWNLELVYLKENGERNHRTVIPRQLRAIEFEGQKCLGLEAYCLDRKEERIFRLPCIVQMREVVV